MDPRTLCEVVVPTVGNFSLLVGCVQRMLETTLLDRWGLVIVCNPVEEHAENTVLLRKTIEASVDAFNQSSGKHCELRWVGFHKAIGWPKAVNAGVDIAMATGAPAICVMNDDVLLTQGAITSMMNSLNPRGVVLQGEFADHGDEVTVRDPAHYGRIGMVGPVSNKVAGAQKIIPPAVNMANGAAFVADSSALLDRFAQELQQRMGDVVMSATFLSGLCVMYRRECVADLLENDELLRPCYGVGGYDDNDVAARAQIAGWRLAIARGTYVHHIGHQTLAAHFPEANLGLSGLVPYLQAWEDYTTREQRIVAVYRVGWSVPWDVAMFGASLRRVLEVVDGVALLATNSPAEHYEGSRASAMFQRLPQPEKDLLFMCKEAGDDNERLQAALDLYLDKVARSVDAEREIQVASQVWDGEQNERDERNAAIALAMQLEPDWCLSVDHDEVIEPGVTREGVQRLMAHPDPLVCSYDTGWANFWDSDRLCRVDRPWANGYSSSMRGYRMWRVQHRQFQRIQAGTEGGLHCGNVPDIGVVGKRVAGFRWKHFGYLRPQDRQRKWKRYTQIDPDPDGVLTQANAGFQGGYDHLINEANMRLEPYRQDNRIGLTMLMHKGEALHDIARHLSHAYALVDAIVLVWTEEHGIEPSDDLRYVCERYGAQIIHHPLADDLGTARNVGLQALREKGIDWCWVMDPDEHLNTIDDGVALRRMVEVSDTWAWLFRFRNHRPDGKWAFSENVRLFRTAGNMLQYDNRVHETLEKSLQAMASRGIHPQVRHAPFVVEHYGLAGGDKRTQEKLYRYTRLLALQIADHPLDSPGAWVSLGLQYGNDGDKISQQKCYEVACATAGNAFLPYREAALFHLRIAKGLLVQAQQRLATAHDLHGLTGQMLEMLDKYAPDQPLLGDARKGAAIPPEIALDDLIAKFVEGMDALDRIGHGEGT